MQLTADRIYLVGPMAVGKSSIGRQLAEVIHYQFVDTDHEIEDRSGADISWIFDVEGEAGFRKRETQVLKELSTLSQTVIATGGGAILAEENRDIMAQTGVVIYLQASLDTLMARTQKDKKRPLLQRGDREAILANMLVKRGPLYESIAHHSIKTESRGIRQSLFELKEWLSRGSRSHSPGSPV